MQTRKKEALQEELQDNSKIEACAIRFGTTGDLTRLKAIQLVGNRRKAKENLYSLSENKFVSVIKSQLLKSNE